MAAELLGYVDVAGSLVVGWAMRDTDRHQIVEVTVEVNGELAVTVSADQPRADLQRVFGSGGHGFEVDISSSLRPGANRIRVKFAETGAVIQRGEYEVVFDGESPLVLRGLDGWMFLRNDSNNVLAKMSGENNFSSEDLVCFWNQHLMRTAYVESLGGEYNVLVTPEKHVVYEEMGGGKFSVAADRGLVRLTNFLSTSGVRNYKYLIEELLAAKQELLVYYKTDTHLSWEGRRVLIEFLAKFVGVRIDLDRWTVINEEMSGNLGSKMRPPVIEKMTTRAPITEGIRSFHETVAGALSGEGRITGNVSISRNTMAANRGSKLYLFGTSGAYTSISAMHTLFEYIVFVWSNAIDLDLLRSFKPDHVIWIATERIIAPSADDFNFRSLQRDRVTVVLEGLVS
ncbi:hypothetical protein BRADO7031 [Bradyrhizobium sp. ORS 278]|uniref:alginate O-acetyltransferase AlgX-related protein n=1 Tax=Bradyrhizobium sp. (strain ORS 278) TaxID=114615 RepID=UPI00015083FC|nr:hypothetical protein [Bradyrhizobium sp. ORS 278]CAL80616.1 hypothetical protein BRADO7031 [Bradyrhizobium sp. ORS 278]